MTTLAAPATVKSLVAVGPDRLEMRDEAAPPAPRPGYVGIRIERTLISAGTELAKISGKTGARSGEDWSENPLPLGYSAAGTVMAVGSPDDPFSIGQRVSASAPHASYAVIPCSQAAQLPDGVSLEAGTFGTLAALALHIVRLSKLSIGDSCAVVGFGVIGELVALMAYLAGAREVAVAEHRPSRQNLAHDLGFALADGRRTFDVVFECAGTPSSLTGALAITQRCGRVVAAGSLREPLTLDIYSDIHAKSITLIGAHGSSQHSVSRVNRRSERENRAVALGYIADGRLPVQRLLTEHIPAGEAVEAFRRLREKRAGTIVLDWSPEP